MSDIKPKRQKRKQEIHQEMQSKIDKKSQQTETNKQQKKIKLKSIVQKSHPMGKKNKNQPMEIEPAVKEKKSQPNETKDKPMKRKYVKTDALKRKRATCNLPLVIRINGQKYVKQPKQSMTKIREYITNRSRKICPSKKGVLFSTDLFKHLDHS